MIEIDIPTIDPIQHEPKVFLRMSKRQILCAVPAAILAILTVILLRRINASIDIIVIAVGIIVFPAGLFGWVKFYNMPFEQFLKLLIDNYTSPQERIYKTDNAVEVKMLTIKEREALEKKNKQNEIEAKKNKKMAKTKTKNKTDQSSEKNA